ncbi:hypothetical protein N665_0015s0065 [Sinapis alba]|nr:hypothetical protein N665_0015s0065 [Sinapis alba]
MATKKSLSLMLSLLMVFTLISLFPTISGKEGECEPQGLCVGEKPEKTCNARCTSLDYKLGGICLKHATGPGQPITLFCCCKI